MTAMSEAVDALTRPWNDVLTPKESGTGHYRAVAHIPLLDMLHDAITSSTGTADQGSARGGDRSVMNVAAFTLWEQIDGTSRAWWKELSKSRASSDLKDVVRELAGLATALHASKQIDDLKYQRVMAQFPRWQAQIWQMFDPPVVKELLGACPHCEATAFYAGDGSKSSALIAYYLRGIRPEAKCQRCGEVWVGERALLELGWHLGATVDEEALRDMGVI